MHIDTDTLALIALGDVRPGDRERAHLAVCALCTEELEALTRTVRLGRSAEGAELVAPPPDVWTRIRSELHLGEQPDPALTRAPVAEWTDASEESTPAPVAEAPRSARSDPHRVPRRRRARRTRRFWIPVTVAALVVGLVAGSGAGVWWQSVRSADAGVVVAGAQLDPFPGWPDARGSAVIEQRSDGRRQVVVDVDEATDAADGTAPLREVWLIRTDGTGLVSIGFLDGTEGRFDVPPGVDLTQYALVDISAESDDGDPAHSGDSIVRGQLRAL